jgi:hypothetical protein
MASRGAARSQSRSRSPRAAASVERRRRRHDGGRDHSRSEARERIRRSCDRSESRRADAHRRPRGRRYYELDRETDREIANQIIDQTRRRAGTTGVQEGTKDLYWNFLFAAGIFLALGVLFLRDRVAWRCNLAPPPPSTSSCRTILLSSARRRRSRARAFREGVPAAASSGRGNLTQCRDRLSQHGKTASRAPDCAPRLRSGLA